MTEFEKLSMPLGWILIGAGNLIGYFVDHGMAILGLVSLVVGLACQIYGTYLKHCDYHRRTRKHD